MFIVQPLLWVKKRKNFQSNMRRFLLLRASRTNTDQTNWSYFTHVLKHPCSNFHFYPIFTLLLSISTIFTPNSANKCHTRIFMTLLLQILSYPVLTPTCCNCLSLHISTGLQRPCSTFQSHPILQLTCCTWHCTFCWF